MTPTYPAWICGTCGETHGRRDLPPWGATWHPGTCDICGADDLVTEPRDFGHLRDGWQSQTRKELT